METIVLNGVWFEVEVTQCYTYRILRDAQGNEHKFYNDDEGLVEVFEFFGT